jgi:hypothetical protein
MAVRKEAAKPDRIGSRTWGQLVTNCKKDGKREKTLIFCNLRSILSFKGWEKHMKKTVVFVLISVALLCASTLFAQTSAQMIIVQSVVGKVEYEVSAGTWAAVTPQMKLAPSTMINTGPIRHSSSVRDKVVTIKAMQKGTIEKLIQASVAGTGGVSRSGLQRRPEPRPPPHL